MQTKLSTNTVCSAGYHLNRLHTTVMCKCTDSVDLKLYPHSKLLITEIATASYKGNVILIGGVNHNGKTLNTVVIYDVKTERRVTAAVLRLE